MMASRVIGPNGTTAFVPNGDSRQDTAIILLGTAQENGLDQRTSVYATVGGFYISDELADLLYDEDGGDGEEGVEVRTTEVSGNPGVPHVGVDDEPVEDEEVDEDEEPDEDPEDEDADEEPKGEDGDDEDGEEDEEDEEPSDSYNPADYGVKEVKSFVKDNPTLAQGILDSEENGENRSTLVKWLTEFINNDSEEE